MRALVWHGTTDIRCNSVLDPIIEDDRDAIIKVTSCAIWGCGPVGQMAIRSAVLLGGRQVIAIDRVPDRLSMAAAGGATTINFATEHTIERLNELTNGKGPEKCIDSVGLEAHAGGSVDAVYDRAKQAMMLEQTGRTYCAR